MNDRSARERLAGAEAWGRRRAAAVLRVPMARRLVSDLARVEVVDRSMALAAQALLALLPLLVVAVAFLPDALVGAALERFQSVTGVGDPQAALLEDGVSTGLDVERVRTQVGLVGVLITVFSASSFSRALLRSYERVWSLDHLGGLAGRRRSLAWLLGWLLGLELVAVVTAVLGRGSHTWLDVVGAVVRIVLVVALWWWSLHYLLDRRVHWGALAPAAVLTGGGIVAYAAGSTLVMPRYAASSAAEFGVLGLVLTVATWLVGFAGVLVVSAVVGRVLAEDQDLRRLLSRRQAVFRRGGWRPPA